MKTTLALTLTAAILWGSSGPVRPPDLTAKQRDDGAIEIRVAGSETPILTQHALPEMRPYLHPLVAPDGKGILTEKSPGHHKHQMGIYLGLLKVNGRDYFHQFGKVNFRRKGAEISAAEGKRVAWSTRYELLDGKDNAQLEETQAWTFRHEGDMYLLDLDWTLKAVTDVEVKKHAYGGLFVRMPWRRETGGKAVNSEGQADRAAEGQRARWVDIGLPIPGRDDRGHIAILDHRENPEHPIPWRVDGQLGVGPARSRVGDWGLKKGETYRARYRLVVYTGETDTERIEAAWKAFQ